jgi:hypothetical protein
MDCYHICIRYYTFLWHKGSSRLKVECNFQHLKTQKSNIHRKFSFLPFLNNLLYKKLAAATTNPMVKPTWSEPKKWLIKWYENYTSSDFTLFIYHQIYCFQKLGLNENSRRKNTFLPNYGLYNVAKSYQEISITQVNEIILGSRADGS